MHPLASMPAGRQRRVAGQPDGQTAVCRGTREITRAPEGGRTEGGKGTRGQKGRREGGTAAVVAAAAVAVE